MIPRHLRVSGFLSYLQPTELDFDSFELACITGQNGAGKSSLLDAMTWALFGKARGKSADVIHISPEVKAAEVALTFDYEGDTYRVLRKLPRGKSTTLEFQIQSAQGWRPLTEKSTSETQARIERALRMDYETFINASFFLQGKADQFTQKKPGERKAILSSILGLEAWDEYKERAAEQRKRVEAEIAQIDGHLQEIENELAEESARKAKLAELETRLQKVASQRAAQESALDAVRRSAALLDGQKQLAETLRSAWEKSRAALRGIELRLTEKESARAGYESVLRRAAEIETRQRAREEARARLQDFETLAETFRAEDAKRQPLLREIEVEGARLRQEESALAKQESTLGGQQASMEGWRENLRTAQAALEEAQENLRARAALDAERSQLRERIAAWRAENETLKMSMNEIKERLDALESAAGAACPLCGQALSAEHRQSTLKQLEEEGGEKGDRFRQNKKDVEESEARLAAWGEELAPLARLESARVAQLNLIAQWQERISAAQTLQEEWAQSGALRLEQIRAILTAGDFCVPARAQLAALDSALAELGYDVAAHDSARKAESNLRGVEEDVRNLHAAREVMKQMEGELAALQAERASKQAEAAEQEAVSQQAAQALQAAREKLPDLNQLESEVFSLREEENETREELGGAQQKVRALGALQIRRREYEGQREALRQKAMRYKILERSFGKDGAPSLLIEQALPQIQDKANDLLDRLSDGQMSVRFNTVAEYKDKKREDLKETLEIQISDGSGLRDYEMYSGGEAFRINFAIRLALSEILAQRKGARLQTLVIDEGFGSQDALGRQRLVEAINLVRHDFAKILVITHLDELKDAFPNRIEVEKTERGSMARVA